MTREALSAFRPPVTAMLKPERMHQQSSRQNSSVASFESLPICMSFDTNEMGDRALTKVNSQLRN
jgi:hypothetical protein